MRSEEIPMWLRKRRGPLRTAPLGQWYARRCPLTHRRRHDFRARYATHVPDISETCETLVLCGRAEPTIHRGGARWAARWTEVSFVGASRPTDPVQLSRFAGMMFGRHVRGVVCVFCVFSGGADMCAGIVALLADSSTPLFSIPGCAEEWWLETSVLVLLVDCLLLGGKRERKRERAAAAAGVVAIFCGLPCRLLSVR
ncbi:hypothetical protein MOQ_000936 [Trypanosoma cruzi marinkellei]|uniref:Uncharacterized protein n=1 Tax=Trypanosoma cruzi marinkellei TaxID=85056 RepID=K2MU91_TRYCR|nr:hypothetical protein MOQ_000936 [Trypanosoma cruzi marinkellei]